MNTNEPDISKKRSSFSVELKQHIVREIETGELSLSGVARKYAVSATDKALEKEARELKEKLGDLTMQIDLLEKLEAYGLRLRKLDSSTITGPNWE